MQTIDEVDRQILDLLADNARAPFTEIAKKLDISPSTVYVRVRKLEDSEIIKGSTLTIDYQRLGYSFVAYVGIFLEKNNMVNLVLEHLLQIPYVIEANVVSGKYNLFCKIRVKNAQHAKEIIYQIDDITGVVRTESMISLDDYSMADERPLMHQIFDDLSK